MYRPPLGFLLGFLVVLLIRVGAAQQDGDTVAPILTPADLPGYTVHRSRADVTLADKWEKSDPSVVGRLPATRRLVELGEIWSTLSPEEWKKHRREQKGKGLVVMVDRYLFLTAQEAEWFATYNWMGNGGWRTGTPDGVPLGDKSWHVVKERPSSTCAVFIKKTTLVAVDVHGLGGYTVNHDLAFSLARVVASRMP